MDGIRREVFRNHDAEGSAHEGTRTRLHFAHLVYPGEIRAVRIDVAKSASHHVSQNEIGSDNPCSQQLSGATELDALWSESCPRAKFYPISQPTDEKCAVLNRYPWSCSNMVVSDYFSNQFRGSVRGARVNLVDSQWLQRYEIASSKSTCPWS